MKIAQHTRNSDTATLASHVRLLLRILPYPPTSCTSLFGQAQELSRHVDQIHMACSSDAFLSCPPTCTAPCGP